jgi:hypothetical protein
MENKCNHKPNKRIFEILTLSIYLGKPTICKYCGTHIVRKNNSWWYFIEAILAITAILPLFFAFIDIPIKLSNWYFAIPFALFYYLAAILIKEIIYRLGKYIDT